ncbi:MAG: hypothetical protein M3463_15225 [Verrucomicrobiota bacterium]|nr:hypothetical protein [Verrucomicrobiota bacterium]
MQKRSIEQLSGLFRPEESVRPVLLLGAGASFTSGVPVAGEMVRLIARYAYASERGRNPEVSTDIMESDIRRFLKKHPWGAGDNFPEMFPFAVEELLTPTSKRRAFFDTVLSHARGPAAGYHAVARMMQRELIHTVLTPNFDSLIEDALRSLAPHSRSITIVNRVRGDAVNFAPYKRNQIVYLHGAVEFYTDRNTIEETERLDNDLVEKARSIISYAPLVVIGYRGFERSVMKHLLEEGIEGSSRYKHGIYWCVRPNSDLHPNVSELAARIGTNFFLVEIAGFDEAVVELDRILSGRAGFQVQTSVPAHTAPNTDIPFDKSLRDDLGLEDLQPELLFTTAKTYAKNILDTDLQPEELERFLEANEFAQRDRKGTLRPTLGLYLLTGRDVSSRFPHLKTLVIRNGKQQQAFDGSILAQLDQLRTELLASTVNGPVRVKLPSGAVEIAPYNERALVELLVNLLAHRDYASRESSYVSIESGSSISFATPGGLMPEVLRKLNPDSAGRFTPIMNVYQVRNPVIADILHSQGVMDKAGSGLADVAKLMAEHYGAAEFSIGKGNESVTVTLKQASSSGDAVANTAMPVGKTVTYLTNALPFLSFPATVYSFPLEERFAKKRGERFPKFEEGSDVRNIAFHPYDGELWLFADPRQFESYFKELGYVDYTRERPFAELILEENRRNVILSLLRKSWECKLRQIDAQLRVEGRDRRAYFIKKDDDGYTIT